MTSKLTFTDLQFPKEYSPEKMRRLNEEFRSITRAMNGVIETLESATNDSGAFSHVLATTDGIGDSHTVSGLEPGMLLVATAEDDVAFRRISLNDLSDVHVDEAEDGQALVRSGNQWVASDLPGVQSLLDPGDDRIVFWSEDIDDLDFLLLGSGLTISGGMLVLDPSVLDHGTLNGLGDDDHPQYPLAAFPEVITGDWTFSGEINFERSIVDLHLIETAADPDSQKWQIEITEQVLEFFLEGDFGEVGESILHVARDGLSIDEISIAEFITLSKDGGDRFISADHGSADEAVLHTFNGDVQIVTQGALFIGEGSEISFRFDDTDSYITTSGDTYWENSAALDTGGSLYLGFDRMEIRAEAPEFVLRSLSADADEGAWGWFATFGQMQIATVNDDGSIGEAWVTVDSVGGVIGDSSINFSGGSLKWNGARILTEDDSVSGSGVVETIVDGSGINIDDTDPANPIISIDTAAFAAVAFSGAYSDLSGTPTIGGSNTQVQFNDSGSFGGDADFVWNKTTNILTLGSSGTPASIRSPQGASTSAGVALTIQAGDGGSTSGNGGALALRGGATTSGAGGSISINPGNGVGSGQSGGSISIQSGSSGTAGAGGAITISAGAGQDLGGGTFTASAGASTTANGGGVTFSGGNGATTGGAVTFQAGTSANGDGSGITFVARPGVGTDKNGGNITFTAGVPTGTGTAGALVFNNLTTTGAQTATFTATNKPGTGTTSPSLWLRVRVSGTTYYIPMWQ